MTDIEKENEAREQQYEIEKYEKEEKRRQRIEDENYYNEGERHNFGRGE